MSGFGADSGLLGRGYLGEVGTYITVKRISIWAGLCLETCYSYGIYMAVDKGSILAAIGMLFYWTRLLIEGVSVNIEI